MATDLKFRCDCPFTSAIDVLGDKWMLVIIKLMLVEGKKTFKDFMERRKHRHQHFITKTQAA